MLILPTEHTISIHYLIVLQYVVNEIQNQSIPPSMHCATFRICKIHESTAFGDLRKLWIMFKAPAGIASSEKLASPGKNLRESETILD